MAIPFKKILAEILPNYLNHKYVVAVSGGVDSMVLLNFMTSLVPANQIVVAHFDHRTRDGESRRDAEFVQKEAQQMGLVFELGSRERDDLSENGLRNERRHFLENISIKHRCDYIVLAHHLQDQLETFLMRLFRGTGMDGLAVMEPKQGLWLRPLLGVSRESIQSEAHDRKIAYRVDSSNLVPQNFRTAIRLNLLPEMEKLSQRYGGKEKWLQRLENLFTDLREIKKENQRRLSKKLDSKLVYTEFWARISRENLGSFSQSERRKVIRVIVSRLGIKTLSAVEVTRLEKAFSEKRKKCSVTGLEMVDSCGFVYFRRQKRNDCEVKLVYCTENSATVCELLGLQVSSDLPAEDFQWRQVLPGDRYRGKKIKEYFLKKRVPLCERNFVPVLARKESQDIEWVFPEPHPKIKLERVDFPFAINK